MEDLRPDLFGIDIETGGVNKRSSPEVTANNFTGFTKASHRELGAAEGTFRQTPFHLQHFDPSGKPYQLLELFAGQGLMSNRSLLGSGTFPGFVAGRSLFLQPQPGFAVSPFAYTHGIMARSRSAEALAVPEEHAIHQFYRGLKREIRNTGQVNLLAWNGVFDLSNFERAAHSYEGLHHYRGFFSREANRGRFGYQAAEDPFLHVAFKYGQENPGFRNRYFRMRGSGNVARSVEDMRQVPGWSLENVSRAFGGIRNLVPQGLYDIGAHAAFVDTRAAASLYATFLPLQEAEGTLREAFQNSNNTLLAGRNLDRMFETIYGNSGHVRSLEEDAKLGARLLGKAQAFQTPVALIDQWRKPLIGLSIFGGTALALGLAAGKRKDRQTQIEGLRHAGVAGRDRKRNTDFGSGWQGLNDESPSRKAYFSALGVAGLYGAHRWALNGVDGYAGRFYSIAREVEQRSPRGIISTLGVSQRASMYLPDALEIGKKDLFYNVGATSGTSRRTRLGAHLERLLPDLDLYQTFSENSKTTLKFEREADGLRSSYLKLAPINGKANGHRVSFVEGGRLGAISEHYGAPLGIPLKTDETFEHGVKWVSEAGTSHYFVPYLAKTEGHTLGDLGRQVSREAFGYADRLNRSFHGIDSLLHKIPGLGKLSLGLPVESYNGTAGLLGRLLTHRVAPIAAAVVAGKYLDYKLNHRPSQFAWDLYAKARIAHADLTDAVPGGREVTDWYRDHVPVKQYGPLALPLVGALTGGLAHYAQVVANGMEKAQRVNQFRRFAGIGAVAGALAMLPFVPGMLGSRKTSAELRAEFSGDKPVEIRAGRWWQFGVSPLSGNRISMYRPHQYVLNRTRAEDISLYGSEDEKWDHNPLISPLTWFKDPNWLANKHADDRPYPMTSPAFSNVPLIGSVLAATIGKLVAPPRRMHEDQWDGSDYTLYTKAVEPKSPRALAPEYPEQEFTLGQIVHRGTEAFEEGIGLPGFLLRSAKKKLGSPGDGKPDVYFEGTRAMTNWSRRFAEMELGGLPFWNPEEGVSSYTEPLRRMIQHEKGAPRVNEIPNQMPSWLPNGDQYFVDFHKGDVYSRVPYGSIRLPGKGYEALHPELSGVDAENYPDMAKLRILGDVAPWSLHFKQMSARVGMAARDSGDIHSQIEYEEIVDRARNMRESTVQYAQEHTGPTEEIEGTVRSANDKEIQLEEFRGRYFSYSGVGGSAADLSALSLGRLNAQQTADDVRSRQAGRAEYLAASLQPGTRVKLVLPRGGADVTHARAVVIADGNNINRELIDRGYGRLDLKRAGSEVQAMDGAFGRLMRRYAEDVSFQGNQSALNPLRYLPSSIHTKLWNQRTALDTYINEEVSGTRMRRWQRPVHDFIKPYLQGAARRLTGNTLIAPETQEKRDLDTLADQLEYLRALYGMSDDPEHRGQHSLAVQRTSIGANLFGQADRLPQTLPGRERKFFQAFLGETDPDQRASILGVVSKEMQDTLLAQWTKEANQVRQAAGTSVEEFDFSGRYVSQEDIDRVTDLNGKVTKVIDGDSLVVSTNKGEREVRLANVNSPEMSTYSGHVAKQMTEKLALGQNVRLHVVGQDKYDRTVADVFTDDKRLLNYELLNSGHAAKDPYENRDGSNQTRLSIGDFFRAREVAEFFERRGLHLPEPESEIMAPDIDYEDVKVKIIQWEGLDFHDYNIYDDRVAMLWRKPYLDGAVRELTAGDKRSVEETTLTMEQAIAQSKSGDRRARVRAQQTNSRLPQNTVRVNVDIRPDEDLKKEIRRNREEYQS